MTDTARTDRETASTGSSTGSGTPAFGELIGELRASFDHGHTRPLEWRRAQLEGLVRLLDENGGELIAALEQDLGRPEIEAYGADIGATKNEIGYLARHFEKWVRPRRVRLPLASLPGRGRVLRDPLGVALVIAPWNYPIQLLLEPMAAAIAAGNAVVAKPSELAPATSAALARLVPRYVDDAGVTVVEGAVPETTALLEQRFDKIFFTGSTRVGRIVMEAAARHLTPVTLELGGKSPTIVAADANLEIAARRIVWGKHLNAGQTCIAPDYVLVEKSVRDELVDHMVATISGFLGDDPKASPDFARIVNDGHLRRLSGYLENHGGEMVTGGDVDPDQRFVAPTIINDPDPESALMTEEIFGPILPVLAVESLDDAVEFVNDRPRPLALYVFSDSGEAADDVVRRTSSGGVCINHTLMHILPPTLPFGGVGDSGMGNYHGKAGFDAFTHERSVLAKPIRPDPSILYPPYSNLKRKLVERFM